MHSATYHSLRRQEGAAKRTQPRLQAGGISGPIPAEPALRARPALFALRRLPTLRRLLTLVTLLTLLTLLTYLHAGCSILHFPDVSGIRHHPSTYDAILQSPELPWLEFDVPVDRRSVEQLFSVRHDGEVVPGRYEWHGSRVTFISEPELLFGRRYHLHFDGQFFDRAGRVHRSTILVPFYFGADDQLPPYVRTSSVEAGGDLAPRSPLVIEFNVPMNRESVEQGLSLRPESDYRPEWNADATILTLNPQQSWPHAVPMTLSLDRESRSEAGLPLRRRYQLTAQVIRDRTRPRVETIEAAPVDLTAADSFAASGVDLRQRGELPHARSAVRVTFSDAMERESTERAFLLSPASAGTYHWPEPHVMVFRPAQGWRPGKQYQLAISDRASGAYGNRLEGQVSLLLRWPVAPLRVVEIRLSEPGKTNEPGEANETTGEGGTEGNSGRRVAENSQQAVITDITDFAAVELTPGLPPHYPYTLVLKFSAPFDSDRRKLGVLDALSLTPALPGASAGPFVVGYGWIDDQTLSVTFHEVRPSTADGSNYLLLTIRGGSAGIEAKDGLRLEEDVRQLLVTREER